jgi:Cu(I)/Ag(I) efflux system membrane protein CusA/SilA
MRPPTTARPNSLSEIRKKRETAGCPFTRADLNKAIMLGAVERVRPKMMTVLAIMPGVIPILWSIGTGSEVMQRIAVPMIGGIVSSTLLTLIVIPVIYALVKGWRACREASRRRATIQLPSNPPDSASPSKEEERASRRTT